MKKEFSAGGIVFKGHQILLTKSTGQGFFQFPKGHIDEGETLEEAATREVKEEGGVEAKIIKKIGSTEYFRTWNKSTYFKNVTYYLMEYLSGDPNNHDWEVEEAFWIDSKEALEKLSFKEDQEILKKALELKNGQ